MHFIYNCQKAASVIALFTLLCLGKKKKLKEFCSSLRRETLAELSASLLRMGFSLRQNRVS